MSQPTIFISYSHDDEDEKSALVRHLSVLDVEVWTDDRIPGGADWESEIRETMATARIAILLISSSFLASRFILEKEVPTLLQRRGSEHLDTFPIIAKPCAWKRVDWLKPINVRPKNGEAVWREGGLRADAELARIVEEIADILDKPVASDQPPNPARGVGDMLDVCIARNLTNGQALDPSRAIELREAFVSGVDVDRLERLLGAFAHEPRLLDQVRRLLREPALQHLARRAGRRDAYERLIFDS